MQRANYRPLAAVSRCIAIPLMNKLDGSTKLFRVGFPLMADLFSTTMYALSATAEVMCNPSSQCKHRLVKYLRHAIELVFKLQCDFKKWSVTLVGASFLERLHIENNGNVK